MRRIIDLTVRLIRAGKRAYEKKWSFFAVSVCIFFGSVVVLGQLDLLPNASSVTAAPAVTLAADARPAASATTAAAVVAVATSELPTKIEIPAIGLATAIVNPTTTSIEVLDQNLLKGAVRYPTSAKLGETGNVVLFGHSSYLPVVNNQAYKTFNNIKKLVAGDVVTVYSAGTAYTYQVRSVTKKSINYDGIPLSVDGKILTLVTCDRSFGEATDRSVVVADFVESHSIST